MVPLKERFDMYMCQQLEEWELSIEFSEACWESLREIPTDEWRSFSHAWDGFVFM